MELFLKYLDDLEVERALEAGLEGKACTYIVHDAHRWSRWVAPKQVQLVCEFENRGTVVRKMRQRGKCSSITLIQGRNMGRTDPLNNDELKDFGNVAI